MLRRVIGEDIELRTIAGAKEATIKIDPGQLEQIVLNLASTRAMRCRTAAR